MINLLRRPLLLASTALLAGCAPGTAPPSGQLFGYQLPGRFEVVGRGPVTDTHTSDLWVFTGVDGRDYAYTGTWGACPGCFGDRMYAWDVTDPSDPVLTDSVMVDARRVNDIKVNAAGTVAVITREGASSRRNGLVVLDLSDPAHPEIASNYFETLTGGVHNTFIEGELVYAVHNGTADVHIIDISDPENPEEVGRWGLPVRDGKYLHDVWVEDGFAYLSYWDDGLVILDVGDGLAGGAPTEPQLVSQYSYQTQWQGQSYGNTHVAFPYTNQAGRKYVFVGDEIFPAEWDPLAKVVPGGYVHVIDVSDPESPIEVAWYEVPGAGVHNLWAEDDLLYTAYYNAGLRVVDVSGELQGDLRAQGRELAVLATSDEDAFMDDAPFAWGPQLFQGLMFVSDFNSGLWVTRAVLPER